MVSAADNVASLDSLAREKMTRVLGASRAEQLYAHIIAETGLSGIDTPDALHRFAKALSKRPGFEGAVGVMLTVQALMKGARAED